MTLKIEIDCDNEAFNIEPALEVGRILNRLVEGLNPRNLDELDGTKLRDLNGNTCGKVTVTP